MLDKHELSTMVLAQRADRKDAEIARWKENHKTVVATKRGVEVRLRSALDGLQAIYTLCAARPENADPEAMLKAIHQIAGNAFDEATAVSNGEQK